MHSPANDNLLFFKKTFQLVCETQEAIDLVERRNIMAAYTAEVIQKLIEKGRV